MKTEQRCEDDLAWLGGWQLTKVCFKLQLVSIAVLLERRQHNVKLCKPASSVAMMRMAESVWVFTMW
jgi:hypothetical protein